MPVHDWTLVDDGIFHAFHNGWTFQLQDVLNGGLLPQGYYALAEQHASRKVADVLTLHAGPAEGPRPLPSPPAATGGTAVAEAPPKVRRKQVFDLADRRRTLAIRHVSGHRLIALVEIVSPANKDRAQHVENFVEKAASMLERGIHVLLVDLFPPGLHDPQGMHGALMQLLDASDELYDLPPDEPLTLASYAAGSSVEANLEHLAVGAALPDMPLFLSQEHYVTVPLETTYETAYRAMPAYWRDVLEGRPPLAT